MFSEWRWKKVMVAILYAEKKRACVVLTLPEKEKATRCTGKRNKWVNNRPINFACLKLDKEREREREREREMYIYIYIYIYISFSLLRCIYIYIYIYTYILVCLWKIYV